MTSDVRQAYRVGPLPRPPSGNKREEVSNPRRRDDRPTAKAPPSGITTRRCRCRCRPPRSRSRPWGRRSRRRRSRRRRSPSSPPVMELVF